MAVRARYYSAKLMYTRRDRWSGSDPFLVNRLNLADPDPMAPFVPEVLAAELELTTEFGPDGWEIVSFDPEPPEPPGLVY